MFVSRVGTLNNYNFFFVRFRLQLQLTVFELNCFFFFVSRWVLLLWLKCFALFSFVADWIPRLFLFRCALVGRHLLNDKDWAVKQKFISSHCGLDCVWSYAKPKWKKRNETYHNGCTNFFFRFVYAFAYLLHTENW